MAITGDKPCGPPVDLLSSQSRPVLEPDLWGMSLDCLKCRFFWGEVKKASGETKNTKRFDVEIGRNFTVSFLDEDVLSEL